MSVLLTELLFLKTMKRREKDLIEQNTVTNKSFNRCVINFFKETSTDCVYEPCIADS